MKKRIYLIAIVMVALAGGFLAVRALLVQINKWQFSYAESAVHGLFTDVIVRGFKPATTVDQNSCARQHREFGDGPLTCTISAVAIYPVHDVSQADQLQNDLRNYIRSHPGKFVYWNSNGFHDFDSATISYSSEAYTLARTAMSCGPSYSLRQANDQEYGLPKINVSQGYLMIFRMSCSKNASRQYYPRSDM